MTTIAQLLPTTWHAGTATEYSGTAAGHGGTQPAVAATSASPPKQGHEPIDSLGGKERAHEDVFNRLGPQFYVDTHSSLPLVLYSSSVANPKLSLSVQQGAKPLKAHEVHWPRTLVGLW